MLARSLRAGRSIDEAVQMAGTQLPEPLAKEFRFCGNQLALGLSLPAVMRSLVDRVRLFDVRIFTTTLSVHRQTGGNLARVLERLAAVVRDRLCYRRQLRSITGAGRFSAGLIAVIGPLLFLFMFFFQPEYVGAMIESPLGQTMLIAAFVLEAVGLVWTARLLKPTY
jgi:tight adherence protein B